MTAYTDAIAATSGLLYHWRGQKSASSGNTIEDDGPNGIDLLASGFNYLLDQPGPVEGEYSFSIGASGRIESNGILAAVDTLPFPAIITWSMWGKSVEAAISNYEKLLAYGDNLTTDAGVNFQQKNNEAGPKVYAMLGASPAPIGFRAPRPGDELFHHYVFVVDRTPPLVKIYIDGQPVTAEFFATGLIDSTYGGFVCKPSDQATFLSQIAIFNRELTAAEILAHYNAMFPAEPSGIVPWVTPASGLNFVRITTPNPGESDWADMLAPAINAAIWKYLGNWVRTDIADAEIRAAAHRAFGYGWKYREAPFGEAQWLDEQGGAVRLAKDWIDPIKPILDRWRDATGMIG